MVHVEAYSCRENTLGVWFRKIDEACYSKGVGFRLHPTLHSFRTTMTSLLQRLDDFESQIVQRIGHKSITSLKCYTTTLGYEGHLQQAHIFIS